MRQLLVGVALAFLLDPAAPSAGLAQDVAPLSGFRVSAWTDENGLPQGAVRALVEDAEGFLWMGTDAGLVRFDGVRFRTWRELGGNLLPAGSVHALTIAPDGTMWAGFGDQAAIARIRGRDVAVYGPPEGVRGSSMTILAAQPSGTVWAGTTDGLLRFDDDRWVPEARGDVQGSVVALATSAAGTLVAATMDTVYEQHATGLPFARIASSSTVLQSLAFDRSDRLWVTDRDIGYRPLADPAAHDPLATRGKGYRLLGGRDGRLWVATSGQGLWRVTLQPTGETASIQSVTDFQGLSSNVIYALLEDRNGNIWAGTTTGLNRVAPQRTTQLQDLGTVTGLATTSQDTVWLNTSDGLTRFVARQDGWHQAPLDAARRHADAMATGGDGALWLADDSGVERLLLSGSALRRERVAPHLREVRSIAASPDGAVWVFDASQGLHRWTPGTLAAVPLPPAARDRRVSLIFADRSGRLWMAGQGVPGALLAVLPNGTSAVYGEADGFGAGNARMLMEDRDGVLWVAGNRGLSRFADGRFVTVRRSPHLSFDSLTSVVEDELGRLWVGSAAGILRFTKAEFDAALDGRWDDVSAVTFDAADGLAGTTGWMGQPPVARSGDGRLWFLTATGVSVVDPRAIIGVSPPGPVRIDVVSADEQYVPAIDGTALEPTASRLRIEFAVPELNPAQHTRFRYRLDGFDPDWIDAGRAGTATYTNLPPRSYQFRVQAQDANGTWQEDGASWSFSVRPAFYQTAWFMALGAASLAGLGWSAWRLRVRQVRRQLAIVHGERARLSRELHDTLLQSLAGVALQCDALAHSTDPESARRGLLGLRRQIEGHVRECRQSLWNLRSPLLEERDLASALRHVAERATSTADLALHLTVTGPARPADGRIDEQLLRIGGEAVTNAVRHSRATTVTITLVYTATTITLTVADDGSGFDVEAAMDADRGHWGLIGMHERARSVNGRISVMRRAGGGTEVAVTAPLDAHHGEEAAHRALHGRPPHHAGGRRPDHQPTA